MGVGRARGDRPVGDGGDGRDNGVGKKRGNDSGPRERPVLPGAAAWVRLAGRARDALRPSARRIEPTSFAVSRPAAGLPPSATRRSQRIVSADEREAVNIAAHTLTRYGTLTAATSAGAPGITDADLITAMLVRPSVKRVALTGHFATIAQMPERGSVPAAVQLFGRTIAGAGKEVVFAAPGESCAMLRAFAGIGAHALDGHMEYLDLPPAEGTHELVRGLLQDPDRRTRPDVVVSLSTDEA